MNAKMSGRDGREDGPIRPDFEGYSEIQTSGWATATAAFVQRYGMPGAALLTIGWIGTKMVNAADKLAILNLIAGLVAMTLAVTLAIVVEVKTHAANRQTTRGSPPEPGDERCGPSADGKAA
jgi:hypothetical protein